MNINKSKELLTTAANMGGSEVTTGDLLRALLPAQILSHVERDRLQQAINDVLGPNIPSNNPNFVEPTQLTLDLLVSAKRVDKIWSKLLSKRPGIAGVILDRAGL